MRGPDRPVAYYDGACPICAREIGLYRRQEGADRIRWVDIGTMNDLPDLSREQALARFTVRKADGSLVSGSSAFILIWKELPRFRWLAALSSSAPLAWLLDKAYGIFLILRPRLQAMASHGAVRRARR
jgi:predicted DCC family thiol-disulfide oxidoreductase YuxK